LPAEITVPGARGIISPFIQDYEAEKTDEIWICYTEFVNAMVYRAGRPAPCAHDGNKGTEERNGSRLFRSSGGVSLRAGTRPASVTCSSRVIWK